MKVMAALATTNKTVKFKVLREGNKMRSSTRPQNRGAESASEFCFED